MPLDLSRREFMQVGSVSVLSLGSTGNLQVSDGQPNEEYEFQGVADLMGPSEARPAAGSDFFDNKVYYWYRYEETDTGARYFISQDDSQWSLLGMRLKKYEDNFDRLVTSRLSDQINVPGEHDFTPERLRYYKNGARRFLMYGTDSTHTETPQGRLIEPAQGDSIHLKTAERAVYPVGFDLWPSQAYNLNRAPSGNDVVGGGYGEIDIGNFDPVNHTYSGSTADGYFWYHTTNTGLDQLFLAEVQSGTIIDSDTVDKNMSGDNFSLIEQKLNWYSVGPSIYIESYTDQSTNAADPQFNEVIGAVSNDTGKGPDAGSQRTMLAIKRDAATSAFTLEAGSVGVAASNFPDTQFKTKGHSMDLDNTNTTLGTYQVCAAMKIADDRPQVKLRIPSFEIISTPGADTNVTRVMMIAVSPENTDADTKTFEPPVEHSAANSVVREVKDNTITAPIEDDAGTDVNGATTANTMTNPGGWQVGRDSITPEGTGNKTTSFGANQIGNRSLFDTDIMLVLVDSDTAGTAEIDVQTEQNS